MWCVTDTDRQILADVLSAGSEDGGEDLMKREVKLASKKRTITIGDLAKRDLLGCDEVEAMRASLPKEVDFSKFVGALQPRFIAVHLPGQANKQEGEAALAQDSPPKDPEMMKAEYRERIRQLKIQQENCEYQAMTRSIDPAQQYGKENLMKDFGREMREVNRQVIAIVNTLITVAGAFAAGYFGLQLAYPQLQLDVATRMLIGLVLATIVFFADLYFIIKTMDAPPPLTAGSSATKRDDYVLDLRQRGTPAVTTTVPVEEESKKHR